jgi:hypothetical protein
VKFVVLRFNVEIVHRGDTGVKVSQMPCSRRRAEPLGMSKRERVLRSHGTISGESEKPPRKDVLLRNVSDDSCVSAYARCAPSPIATSSALSS